MAAVINTTITAVQPREVTSKKDGKTYTFWDVYDANGDKWDARSDTANIARQFIGQPVTIVTRTEQNGTFINKKLDSVELNMGQQIQQQFAGTPQVPDYAQAAMQAQPQVSTPQPQYTPPADDRTESIYRQVACKVAAHTSTSQVEFWKNVDELIHFFRTGIAPIGAVPYVQAGGGFDSPPAYTDSDIPFAPTI